MSGFLFYILVFNCYINLYANVHACFQPTVLNCGHMFCKSCINEWKSKKKICPMCRTKITGCVQVFNLDTIIEKNVALMSSESRLQREKTIEMRTKGQYTFILLEQFRVGT